MNIERENRLDWLRPRPPAFRFNPPQRSIVPLVKKSVYGVTRTIHLCVFEAGSFLSPSFLSSRPLVRVRFNNGRVGKILISEE